MRIALLTVIYKNTIRSVYNSKPELKTLSYLEQKKVVDREISVWASGWENALIKKGFEFLSIPINVKPMQLKWAKENYFNSLDIHEIAYRQIEEFKPDILWYDYFDIPLIRKIKSNVNSIKLVLGWTGSFIVDFEILKEVDLILSCAPETVGYLNQNGLEAKHLNHAFNPLLLKNVEEKKIDYKFTFIGQVIRGKDYLHRRREKLLKLLGKELNLTIFSPTYNFGLKEIFISFFKKAIYVLLFPFTGIKWLRKEIEENEYLKEIVKSRNKLLLPYDFALKKKMRPAVYEAEMYDIIFKSLVVLNIHADSSPEYASNMRLFETTGIGTCLLTDWRKNISDLFIDDKEIITYKSDSDCIEKAKWLLTNPEKCLEIGRAGQIKTLSHHTYDNRVEDLLKIINEHMKL
jgi:spore maturation protein CgeB